MGAVSTQKDISHLVLLGQNIQYRSANAKSKTLRLKRDRRQAAFSLNTPNFVTGNYYGF